VNDVTDSIKRIRIAYKRYLFKFSSEHATALAVSKHMCVLVGTPRSSSSHNCKAPWRASNSMLNNSHGKASTHKRAEL
jgi:hypothetical protein